MPVGCIVNSLGVAPGGVLTFAAGFRILKIKQVRLTNIVPAVILVPIFSAVFAMFG